MSACDPSCEPLSTTMISSTWRVCVRSALRHSLRRFLPFQLTMMALTVLISSTFSAGGLDGLHLSGLHLRVCGRYLYRAEISLSYPASDGAYIEARRRQVFARLAYGAGYHELVRGYP